MFICTCNVKYDEYNCWGKHAFVYDSHFKHLHQSKYCGDLVDNRADAPIFVLKDKDRERNHNLKYSLKYLFGCPYHVEYVYKITSC